MKATEIFGYIGRFLTEKPKEISQWVSNTANNVKGVSQDFLTKNQEGIKYGTNLMGAAIAGLAIGYIAGKLEKN